MTNLQLTWTIVFAIAFFLFAVVEIAVVVGGARDLFHMMKVLLKKKEE